VREGERERPGMMVIISVWCSLAETVDTDSVKRERGGGRDRETETGGEGERARRRWWKCRVRIRKSEKRKLGKRTTVMNVMSATYQYVSNDVW
jgi:hypothetical protein